MTWNWLNPNWLLCRLLERTGIATTYLSQTEFGAHVAVGGCFAFAGVLWSMWLPIAWSAWTLIDEFVFDGYKGKDTWIDLASKLAGPIVYGAWMIWTGFR